VVLFLFAYRGSRRPMLPNKVKSTLDVNVYYFTLGNLTWNGRDFL